MKSTWVNQGCWLPGSVEVDLTRVQLNVLLLIEDAVDDGLQHFMQVQHAHCLLTRAGVERGDGLKLRRDSLEIIKLTFMNCSMALEASELDRNKVFGSASRAGEGKEKHFKCGCQFNALIILINYTSK